MKQEDKELLLKDLCSRLPYGVKVEYRTIIGKIQYIEWEFNELCLEYPNNDYTVSIEDVKPYIRPMSSMTEVEKEELSHYEDPVQRTDFFYSHNIDCRFMIEKGLALEAPEGMYNN